MEKTEAVTTLCRNIATIVKPRELRHLEGQLKSAWSGHRIRFFQIDVKNQKTFDIQIFDAYSNVIGSASNLGIYYSLSNLENPLVFLVNVRSNKRTFI